MKTYSIVGMEHQKSKPIVDMLDPGAPVTLVREPNNEHDLNAVAVWVDGRKVGYVPRKQNAALAQYIDQTGRTYIPSIPPSPAGAMDENMPAPETTRAIDAKFRRSPNSGYPLVEVAG